MRLTWLLHVPRRSAPPADCVFKGANPASLLLQRRPRLRPNHLAPFTSSFDPIRLCSMASEEGDTSPLFWLPEEILELIVEQAPAKSLPVLLQTCRRLARIARKRLYATLRYGGEVEPYAKLVDLLEMRPDLHEFVKDVTITSVFNRRDRGAGDHYGYPGTDRTLVRFPSLTTLRIAGASLSQVTQILAASPTEPLPPLQHVAIELLAAEWSRFSEFAWWEALARFPDLGKLTLHGRPNPRRRGFEHADPGDRSRVPATLENIHTLNIYRLPAPTDGSAAFATDVPALTSLTLKDRESMMSRWLSIAPLGLRHITLWIMVYKPPGELARQLGRFPNLQHLRLVGNFALKDFVPFLRTDKLRHLELHYDTTCNLADDLEPLLDLICGPGRTRHLQSIHLGSDSDHCQTSHEEFRDCLRNVIKGTANYDLTVTDLKLDYDPFHGLSTAEDVQRLVEAARSNGIKLAGSALRCLDWGSTLTTSSSPASSSTPSGRTTVRSSIGNTAKRVRPRPFGGNGRFSRRGFRGTEARRSCRGLKRSVPFGESGFGSEKAVRPRRKGVESSPLCCLMHV